MGKSLEHFDVFMELHCHTDYFFDLGKVQVIVLIRHRPHMLMP